MRFWLMKTEPSVFSFADLKERPKKTEPWNGVRNYQARNFMRDDMKKGDLVLFYHSNCKEPLGPGIMGLADIACEAYPETLGENWVMVDVRFVADFKRPVFLHELRACPELKAMKLLAKGQRLSVMPVEEKHFRKICQLGGIESRNFIGS